MLIKSNNRVKKIMVANRIKTYSDKKFKYLQVITIPGIKMNRSRNIGVFLRLRYSFIFEIQKCSKVSKNY